MKVAVSRGETEEEIFINGKLVSNIPPGTDLNAVDDDEDEDDSIFEVFTQQAGVATKNVIKTKQARPKAISPFQIIKNFLADLNLRRNEITLSIESNGRVLTEQAINSHFIKLVNAYPNEKKLSKANFETYINSDDILSYNPIKNFIEQYSCQKTSRNIEKLVDSLSFPLNKALEKKSPGLTKLVITLFLKKWLIGMIASVYDNNYNCLMIVLVGPKGCGKTEFWRRLLPTELLRYFTQSKFDNGKDDAALMCENLVALNDELDGLHAKEAKAFRAFISTNIFDYRVPYGKQNAKRKRLASICGASNEKNIISDPDNNRRIIPIEIFKVNHEKYNAVNKTHLLVEAFHLFKEGFDWNLTEGEMIYLDAFSEGYEVPSLELELLQKYFTSENGTEELTASEIKVTIDAASGQKLSLNKLGRALRSMQFPCTFKKVDKKTQQVYTCSRTQWVNDFHRVKDS